MRDPQIMNLVWHVKILWRMLTGDNTQWKQALQKKYMASIENVDMRKVGSPVWELCKKSAYLIQENLYWEPGNKIYIKILHDKLRNHSLTNYI